MGKITKCPDASGLEREKREALLISVCDRDIVTKRYPSKEAALEAMRAEMLECLCMERSDLYKEDGTPFAEAEEDGRYAISGNGAWVNAGCECDWQVIVL